MNSVPKKSTRFTLFIAFLLMALLFNPSFSVKTQAASPSISAVSFTAFQETEPNNTRSQADLVNSGYFGNPPYSLQGTISNVSTDFDYYRLETIIAGELRVNGRWTGPRAGLLLEQYMTLRLEDASGKVIKTSGLAFNYHFDHSQALWMILPPGTYYLRAAAATTDRSFNGAPYKLDTIFLPSCGAGRQPTPIGPSAGNILTSYNFSAHDRLSDCGQTVQTRFDWGDGTVSSWSTNRTRSKSWAQPGTYSVRVLERCSAHTFIYGEWSSTLTVTISAPIFQLTVQSADPSQGTVSGSTSQQVGTSVTASAFPVSGYRFYRWQENSETVSRNNPFTFNLMNEQTLTAHFRDGIDSQRLHGTSRYLTAIAISQDGWAEGADAVVLARGNDYADALAGVPLAYQMNAPILLTNSQYLSASTRTEIERLGAKEVVILGGSGAISTAVEDELENMELAVVRIQGDNRYHTAALIADAMRARGNDYNSAIVAVGTNFPDALAAASYAAMTSQPILLTTKDILPNSTSIAIDSLDIQSCTIVGGTGVISAGVETLLGQVSVTSRIFGDNRYSTSIALAEHYLTDVNDYCIATGWDFPDAVTGAVLAAKRGTGILLVLGSATSPPAVIQDFLVDEQVGSVTLFGGSAAISDAMKDWF